MIVKSDWRTNMWSFGAWSRKVMVDRQLSEVRIRQRTFWIFVKRIIVRFQDVQEILYGYSDLSPGSVFAFAWQTADLFTVALHLKTGDCVNLFRFFGEGQFINNTFLPDWWYWEESLHARITNVDQSDASLSLADLLSQLIGAPIGNLPA